MIGDTLKKLRSIYGYKASEMSESLEISNSFLSEIENNKKKPSLELLQRYSKIFGIKVSSLLLLSEQYEEAEKNGNGANFIKHFMQKLIDSMSSNIEDDSE